jgi:hypothetical protein
MRWIAGTRPLIAVRVSATDAKRTWSNFQLRSIGEDQTDKKAKSVCLRCHARRWPPAVAPAEISASSRVSLEKKIARFRSKLQPLYPLRCQIDHYCFNSRALVNLGKVSKTVIFASSRCQRARQPNHRLTGLLYHKPRSTVCLITFSSASIKDLAPSLLRNR